MKRIISLLLAILIFTAITPTILAVPSFSDVQVGHWAYFYIAALADTQVINGYEDGSYKPEREVTRAEWSKLFTLSSKLELFDMEQAHLATENSDMDGMADEWYTQYLLTASPYFAPYYNNGRDEAEGISYYPNRAATREDVIVSIGKLKGNSVANADLTLLNQFSDTNTISDAAKPYFAYAVWSGLIMGFEDGTLRPQAVLSRAQAAAIICRVFPTESEYDPANVSAGKLRLGFDADEVMAYLGEPETKSEEKVFAYDGALHQTWSYPAEGVELCMSRYYKGYRQSVCSVTIEAPSELKLNTGIGIGDHYNAVDAIYQSKIYSRYIDEDGNIAGVHCYFDGVFLSFSFENDVIVGLLIHGGD